MSRASDNPSTLPASNRISGKGNRMARTRWIKGSVKEIKSASGNYWRGRYSERIVRDGRETIADIKVRLGSTSELPTKKLAMRALEPLVKSVNDRQGKAKRVSDFAAFAERWKKEVMVHIRMSSQSSDVSICKKHLIPYFGEMELSDIGCEDIQKFINEATCSPKTIRNRLDTLRRIWQTAKAWGYVSSDPFPDLRLPERVKAEQPYLTIEQMRLIVTEATGQEKTMYWIASEGGVRGGELVALSPKSLDLVNRVVKVTAKIYNGRTETPKTRNGIREFRISPRLAEHLSKQEFTHETLLFPNAQGKPRSLKWLLEGHFYPLLDRLGIPRCGIHAFRHGNATVMDQMNVPDAVRLKRIGHASIRTTRDYSHAVPANEEALAERLGVMLTEVVQ